MDDCIGDGEMSVFWGREPLWKVLLIHTSTVIHTHSDSVAQRLHFVE